MDAPFFRSQWNVPSHSRPRYYSPDLRGGFPVRRQPAPAPSLSPKPKVVSIPVHFVGSESSRSMSRSDAALEIQKAFRGFLVRKSVKRIAAIGREVDEIDRRISDAEVVGLMRRDDREKLKMNEMLMSALFRLDSIRGVDRGVRELRKTVIRKAIALQERIDAIAAEGSLKSDEDASQSAKSSSHEMTTEGEEAGDSVPLGNENRRSAEPEIATEGGDAAYEEPLDNENLCLTEREMATEGGDAAGRDSFNDENLCSAEHEIATERGDAADRESLNDENCCSGVTPPLSGVQQLAEVEHYDYAGYDDCRVEELTGKLELHAHKLMEDEAKREAEYPIEADRKGNTDSKDEEHGGVDMMEIRETGEGEATPSSSECVEEMKTEGQGDYFTGDSRSLIEGVDENTLAKEDTAVVTMEVQKADEEEEEEEGKDSEGKEDRKKNELLERMMEDNEKMMGLMKELFERNERQTRLLSSLSQRVEQLERAFVCEKLRRKKKRQAGGGSAAADHTATSPDPKKCGWR